LEARSEHPLARAVLREAQERGVEYGSAQEFHVVAGQGVSGNVDGVTYTIGRPEWAQEQGLEMPPGLRSGLIEAETRGESVIALMDNSRVLALLALADRVRPSAKAAVSALKELEIEPIMITGDAAAVA